MLLLPTDEHMKSDFYSDVFGRITQDATDFSHVGQNETDVVFCMKTDWLTILYPDQRSIGGPLGQHGDFLWSIQPTFTSQISTKMIDNC